MPVALAWRTRLAVDSRNCVTAPGAASTSATDMVWIESITRTSAPVSATRRGCARRPVSATQLESCGADAEPARALGHLAHGFLAGRVQHGLVAGERRGALQQQRRLADAGLAADQRHRARDEAAAQHAVELREAGRHARFGLASRAARQPRRRPPRVPPGRRRARAVPRKLRACSIRRRTGIVRSIAVHRRRRTNRRTPCEAWPSQRIRDRGAAMLARRLPPTGAAGLRPRSRFLP